jgi:DNA repair photolyase
MALGVFAVTEKPRKLKGRIMFPTTHDILPSLLPVVVPYLKGWLDAGNEILIVTKPHLDVIQALCDDLFAHRDQILFRFTIGSTDDATLKFWEPGAPGYLERLTSLKFAKLARFKTSVSCEPYLDASIWDLVMDVYPHVTNDIWIGLMNNIVSRVNIEGWSNDDHRFLYVLLGQQHPNAVRYLYNSLRNAPKIRWKDSIRKMLNLPDNSEVIG